MLRASLLCDRMSYAHTTRAHTRSLAHTVQRLGKERAGFSLAAAGAASGGLLKLPDVRCVRDLRAVGVYSAAFAAFGAVFGTATGTSVSAKRRL